MKSFHRLPLRAILLFIACYPGLNFAGNAVITLFDAQQNPVPNTPVVLHSASVPQSLNGGTVVQWRGTAHTDPNGQITLTNAVPGTWQVQPVSQNLAAFTFCMPVTNGTIRAEEFLVADANSTLPPDTVSYGVHASDRRYEPAGTAAAMAGEWLVAASNRFAQTVITTNPFTTLTNLLTGAGVAAANGPYAPFDLPDILAGNTVNPNGCFLFSGGPANGALTSYPLEIDDPSGQTNFYYCPDTNGLIWFAANSSFNPPPSGCVNATYTTTNLANDLGPVAANRVLRIVTALGVVTNGSQIASALAALAAPPAFNAAGLTNQWPAGPEIHGAFPRPCFVFYARPFNNDTETTITNALNWFAASPYAASLTNAGFDLLLYLDVEATFRRDPSGSLLWNDSFAPDGPAFLTSFAAQRGFACSLGMYGATLAPLPSGMNGAVCPLSGGNSGTIQFYSGPGTNLPAANWADVSLPGEIARDLATLQSWGFAAAGVNDLDTSLAAQQQLQGEFAAAAAPLRRADGSRPFGLLPYDTRPDGTNIWGDATRRFHNAAQADTEIPDAETWLRAFRQTDAAATTARDGAYFLGQGECNAIQPMLTAQALVSAWITPGYFTPLATFTNTPWLPLVTNALWQSIAGDPQQVLAGMIQDWGTNGSAWLKPLTGGRFALGVFNGSPATTNLTVTLPAAWGNAAGYSARNVWSLAAAGPFTSSFVVSNLAPRGSANSAALFLCQPAGWTGAFALTNGTSLYVTNGVIVGNH